MDTLEPKTQTNTISWITSLAITVTCCAIQFVIFAGYIFDLKESISILRIRSDMADERLKQTTEELENLRRHANVQQIQILPAPNGAAVQLPLSLSPPEGRAAESPVPTGIAVPMSTAIPMGTAVPLGTTLSVGTALPAGTAAMPPVTLPMVVPEPSTRH